MAWTNPKTWSFGEILTSTDMNTYVRDNTQELFDRDVVRQVKQVTTTTNFTTTSTTAVDLTAVTVTIVPSDAAHRIVMFFTASVENNNAGREAFFQFRRDTTDLFEEVEVNCDRAGIAQSAAMMFDEVAGSTASRDYLIRTRVNNTTMTVNNSTLIVMEYAV